MSRLTWAHSPEGEAGEPACWYVEGFPVDVSVMEDRGGYDWYASATRGWESDLDAAKEAAETAALKLLCEAVAAFNVVAPEGHFIYTGGDGTIGPVGAAAEDRDRAIALACSLLSAATKASGEVDRG